MSISSWEIGYHGLPKRNYGLALCLGSADRIVHQAEEEQVQPKLLADGQASASCDYRMENDTSI